MNNVWQVSLNWWS